MYWYNSTDRKKRVTNDQPFIWTSTAFRLKPNFLPFDWTLTTVFYTPNDKIVLGSAVFRGFSRHQLNTPDLLVFVLKLNDMWAVIRSV